MATMTFYPDAHPETTSVDGYVAVELSPGTGVLWSSLKVTAGNKPEPSGAKQYLGFASDSVSNRWRCLGRHILLFDTSGLGAGVSISAATLSIRGFGKSDPASNTPTFNIYSSNPASNTDLIGADFSSLGSTPLSSPITFGNWDITDYNNFALNASGIAAISKTAVSKFGVREAKYDVGDDTPTWSASIWTYVENYFADQGSGYQPKLVVTYTVPKVGRSFGLIIG